MPDTLSRRRFCASASLVLAAPFVWPRAGFAQTRAANPLRIPPLYQGEMRGNARHFDLSIQDGQSEFFDGVQTATRGINGAYLAPVVQWRAGEDVVMNVKNTLDEETTLHWHGLNLPARADGGPHQIIGVGETWSPGFNISDKAATMWFHAHLLGKTADHVWQGIAGMAIIEDDESDALPLPRNYGVDDIPVVLQDRRFDRSGQMPYAPERPDRMIGLTGDVAMVNGTVAAYFEVTTRLVRLRLLNGSNGSIYRLSMGDGRAFQVIASDGGLLGAPVMAPSLTLAPGERAEIVVEMAPDDRAMLVADLSGGMGGMMGGMMGGARRGGRFEFLELRAGAALAASDPVPQRLAMLAPLPAQAGLKQRDFELEMSMGPAVMLFGGGFEINGRAMKMSRINEVVNMGETEIWRITNRSPMAHPFHVHDTQFRILRRNGAAPHPTEAGRKDTVLVQPDDLVELAVRFDRYRDSERPYMYHCHILEHEDQGMMGQFTVV